MIIVFGTRGVKSTIKTGDFICPQCNQTKTYRQRKVTQFFHLFFIPIIPLFNKKEYVECLDCKGTFMTRVLDSNNSNRTKCKAIYETAIKHSMVLIMLADGRINEFEKRQVHRIINKYSQHAFSLNQLDEYIEKVKIDKEDVSRYLKMVAPSLNEHGKEIIIRSALSVSAADGDIDQSELKIIHQMAYALEMSSSHLKGILSGLDEIINEQKSHWASSVIAKEDHKRFMPN